MWNWQVKQLRSHLLQIMCSVANSSSVINQFVLARRMATWQPERGKRPLFTIYTQTCRMHQQICLSVVSLAGERVTLCVLLETALRNYISVIETLARSFGRQLAVNE